MQFHLNGFVPGDPLRPAEAPAIPGARSLPLEIDVLVVGCGPAGLTLAAQLSAFPAVASAIIEQKDGPLQLGQADGIACRTMEMFEAFGFSDEVAREAYWVNETVFWKPGQGDVMSPGIVRASRVQDVEDGLSEMPHVILNQARVHDHLLSRMRNGPCRLEPFYSRRVVSLERTADDSVPYPVAVTIEHRTADGQTTLEILKARFVVGCDGARSSVRQSIGRELRGRSANQAWGVMDVLAVTDFPDVRYKAAIQSANEGSILIIPREGGYLTRFYVELEEMAPGERIASRGVTVEQLVATAQRILRPYTLDVKEVAWWSCYEIGQRVCEKFDDVGDGAPDRRLPRIFIAGDACHTHSPKAGQGMNVSMQDSFNLGWKLAAVVEGRARPELLHTYSAERQAIAEELIDFDRQWAAMFSAQPQEGSEARADTIDPADFQRYFIQHGRFTAGVATRYRTSELTGSDRWKKLAPGFALGMRFHSGEVVRVGDGKPMQLGHEMPADGRWRLFLFADDRDNGAPGGKIHSLCTALTVDPSSPLKQYTAPGEDPDAVLDVRCVFQQSHHDLMINDMPDLLWPAKGRYGLRDMEKIYSAQIRGKRDIFDLRGIDRGTGCMVLVRPDRYVAQVLPLDSVDELGDYLARVFLRRSDRAATEPARLESMA